MTRVEKGARESPRDTMGGGQSGGGGAPGGAAAAGALVVGSLFSKKADIISKVADFQDAKPHQSMMRSRDMYGSHDSNERSS